MTGLGDIGTMIPVMLEAAGTFITWCCSTFPINVAVAGSVIGTVMYTVRRGKRVIR